MISHSKRFIFVHIYKVAGQSITTALSRYQYKPPMFFRVANRLGMFSDGLGNYKWMSFGKHIYAIEYRNRLPGEIYNQYYKFAFVRNPWDWQVSQYHYALQNPRNHHHKIVSNMSGFDEYIEWRVFKDKWLQKDFVVDENNNLIVDFVGKLENIENDFNSICRHLGISAELPHVNKSRHASYKDYYSEYSKNLIAEHFKEDIELFGYEEW